MINIKRSFTLIELMVTLSLIIISFSFIGVKINDSLYSHRFKNNIKKIDVYFDFCKKMALSNQADIYLKISQKDHRVKFEIGTDEVNGFFKNTQKTIEFFDDLNFLFDGTKVDKVEIVFTQTQKIIPNAAIEFFDTKNKFKQIKSI